MRTRHDGFGDEVKRRIMLGTYALSSGYYDAYYGTAQKVRTVIKREHDALFERFDVLVSPTCATTAFPLGAKAQDPLAMYLTDVLTIPSNMAGLPSLSLPCGLSEGLPVGLQLIGPPVLREHALPGRARARGARSASTRYRGGCDELGAGHRARDPRPAEDADEDVLPLRERLRRRPEHADLPRLPRLPGRASGAQPARDRGDDQARSRARLRDRRARGLPPQELLLPRPAQGLPDLPVRRAALPRRAASSSRPRRARLEVGIVRAHLEEDAAKNVHLAALGPHPRCDRDARRLQPRRLAAARDRHRARDPLGRARQALPAAAAPDRGRARPLRRRAREGVDALRRQRLGASRGLATSCARAPSSRT